MIFLRGGRFSIKIEIIDEKDVARRYGVLSKKGSTNPEESGLGVRERILQLLKANGNFQNSDSELIDLYVETYEFFVLLRRQIMNGEPMMIEHTNKYGATNMVKNPLISEYTKTIQTLNNLLKSLGLTPAQRKNALPSVGGDDFENF